MPVGTLGRVGAMGFCRRTVFVISLNVRIHVRVRIVQSAEKLLRGALRQSDQIPATFLRSSAFPDSANGSADYITGKVSQFEFDESLLDGPRLTPPCPGPV